LELTTLRIEKQTIDLLNSLKGHLEYVSGKRLTLNDALMSILVMVDSLYEKRQSLIDIGSKAEVQEQIKRRIDQFWGKDNKEKPYISFIDNRIIIVKENKLTRRSKSLFD